MTEFDEEKLRQALRDAADGFAISDGATEKILDEARASDLALKSVKGRAHRQARAHPT